MSASWVADPTTAWTIALHARLRTPVDADDLRSRLTSLPLPGTVSEAPDDAVDLLLERVTSPSAASLRVAVAGTDLVVGAEHERCDGLGLLAVLEALTAGPVTSSARGVGDRPERTGSGAATRQRLREVLVAPPATVAAEGGVAGPGDSFAVLTVEGRIGVAELTHAAVRAVREHNDAHGARSTRVAVAIGASRTGGAAPTVSDHSALLRLKDVEDLPLSELRDRIRAASPEPAPPGARGGSRLVSTAGTVALGVLSPRLGSTLLVSHLGEVAAPDVTDLAFYPVTGGGSGVSLGAVGHGGRTTLTLRGRRRRHGSTALAALASRVRAALLS